jgi:alanine-synthesizing transaminase
MFSRHTAWTAERGPLESSFADLCAAGVEVLDLTISNPTSVGLTHDGALFRGLCDERSALYEPASLGLADARAAVAAYYTARGAPGDAVTGPAIEPETIGLCASSSEAYSFLLALLCDPNDTVLVPQPGYPLLAVLSELAHTRLVGYPLTYAGGWSIDLAGLEHALAAADRPRAVVVVAPNNPTGNYLAPDELAALDAMLAAREIALIVDEVFWDYPLRTTPRTSPTRTRPNALTFVVSGLSKVAALPQLKLAWWLALGPPALVREATARLELIADTYLSAATPVQLALPRLLAAAPAMQAQISRRTRSNLDRLRAACVDTTLTVLDVEAGWTALVRLPAVHDLDDAAWARELLLRGRLRTQPGQLYDLHGAPHVALSLLTPEATWATACDRLRDTVAEVLASGPCSR